MKKNFVLISVIVLALMSVAAIKFFSDYPNSIPSSSDLFVLQRGSDYVNSSVAQTRTFLFSYPSFSGDGYIPGQWHVGGDLWVQNGIIYGNGAGISNSGSFATYVSNFYATTITNVSLITSNVVVQYPGGFTNLNLTPKAVVASDINDAIVSIPNHSGALTNDGGGNFGWFPLFLPNTGGSATNMSLWGTNSFQEIDTTTLYATNLVLPSLLSAAFLATDGSGNVSQTFNGNSLTNLAYQYVTNNSGSTTLSWSTAYRTNLAADVTIALASVSSAANAPFYQTIIYWVTNNSGSNHKVTSPSGVIGPVGSGTPSAIFCTNNTLTRILFEHFGSSDIVVSKTDFGP